MNKGICSAGIFYGSDASAEADFRLILAAPDAPEIAVFKPVVRLFYLKTVFYALLKYAEAVSYAAAVSGIAQR